MQFSQNDTMSREILYKMARGGQCCPVPSRSSGAQCPEGRLEMFANFHRRTVMSQRTGVESVRVILDDYSGTLDDAVLSGERSVLDEKSVQSNVQQSVQHEKWKIDLCHCFCCKNSIENLKRNASPQRRLDHKWRSRRGAENAHRVDTCTRKKTRDAIDYIWANSFVEPLNSCRGSEDWPRREDLNGRLLSFSASSEESVGVLMNSSGPGVSPAAVFLASN